MLYERNNVLGLEMFLQKQRRQDRWLSQKWEDSLADNRLRKFWTIEWKSF